jgi:predicted NAD-dependent protein-ADP-ribosyltransferase YbiA (DUF1768 family)
MSNEEEYENLGDEVVENAEEIEGQAEVDEGAEEYAEPERDTTPYTKEETVKIRQFYKKRQKKPLEFIYSDKGDLVFGNEILFLKSYVPLTTEDRSAMNKARLTFLIRIERTIEEKKRELRELTEAFKKKTVSVTSVVACNREVESLEKMRVYLRSQERSIRSIDNPARRDILFDNQSDVRKLIKSTTIDPYRHKVFALVTRDFSPRNFYGKYVTVEGESPGSIVSLGLDVTRTLLKDGRIARFFYEGSDADPKSFLSPLRSQKVVVNDTEYSSALQAYEGERCRELGREDKRSQIMHTKSVRTVRIIMKQIEEQVENPEALWQKVLRAAFSQNEDLKMELLSTASDILAYADPTSNLYGIGVGLDSDKRLDVRKWPGQNLVGGVMEQVRSALRESEGGAPVAAAAERVISEEEQGAAKKGAIIRAKSAARG